MLKDAITDREFNKFTEVENQHAVNVNILAGFQPPALADAVTATYPSSTQEVYAYRQGGVSGTILKTITIDYVDATKELISSAVIS